MVQKQVPPKNVLLIMAIHGLVCKSLTTRIVCSTNARRFMTNSDNKQQEKMV